MDYNYVANNGMTTANPPTGLDAKIVLVFFSVALFNVLELIFIIYTAFKRRSGLYFWSFIVATASIVPHSVGFLLKYFTQQTDVSMVWAGLTFFGWCGMVTGQSLVLWSRLHLVMYDRRRQRAVLGMIITDAIICHGAISVLVFGVNSHHPQPFVQPYAIAERIQLTIFALQEAIISGLYIYETAMLLRREKETRPQNSCHNNSGTSGCRPLGRIGYTAWRRVLTHLVYISVIIILLDAPLLVLQYSDLYDIQTSYKAFVYSVKLKLEFSILNRLIEVTTGHAIVTDTLDNELAMGGAGGTAEGRLSSRDLRRASSSKATSKMSPRQAYEDIMAELRSETPPPLPLGTGMQVARSENRPDGGSGSDSMTINMALGDVGETRMVKTQDEEEKEQKEECRGFALMPFEARAFRFDDDVEARAGNLDRSDSSVSGGSGQAKQSENQAGFDRQRRTRSDEGAYLRSLDVDAIKLEDLVARDEMRPRTEPMEGSYS